MAMDLSLGAVGLGVGTQQTVLAQILGGANFFADLTHSLVPNRGTGSPTFTRATTATVMGYGPTANSGDSQTLLTVAANEARFVGARRISEGVWSDTFADGSPIPSSTLLGYQTEGARTNLCTYSNGFDNAAWSKLNSGTGVAPVVTPNYAVAPDGTTTAYRVQLNRGAGAGSGNYSILRSTPASGLVNPHTSDESLWVKTTGGGTATILFGSSYAVGFSVTVTSEWTRLDKSQSVLQTIDGIDIYLRNGVSLTNDQSADILIWGAQLELGSFASSYIPTTTVAVTRNADVLTYPSSENFRDAAGWVYAEVTATNSGATERADVLTDSSGFALYSRNDLGKQRFYNGTNDVSLSDLIVPYASKKIGWTWTNAVSASGSVNGSTAVTAAAGGTLSVGASLKLGSGVGQALFGTIRNVRIGQRQLSSSELQAITA